MKNSWLHLMKLLSTLSPPETPQQNRPNVSLMFVKCGLIIRLYYKDPIVTSLKEAEALGASRGLRWTNAGLMG